MNLYSAISRKAPQWRSVHNLANRIVFNARRKTPLLSRFTQFDREWIPDGRTDPDREGPPTECATVLRPYRGTSKRCRLWLNGASCSKSYYWQPIRSCISGIDWYQTEWPWPLFRGRRRWCQPLRHIHHWISRKPLEMKAWSKGSPIGNSLRGIQWSRDRWRHVTRKVKSWPQVPNISKTAGDVI